MGAAVVGAAVVGAAVVGCGVGSWEGVEVGAHVGCDVGRLLVG